MITNKDLCGGGKMCIAKEQINKHDNIVTKEQIYEFGRIFSDINVMDSEEEIYQYLNEKTEDPEFFCAQCAKINKSKLKLGSKKKKRFSVKKEAYVYQKEEVISIFEKKSLSEILAENSKAQLAAMYISIYCSKPLSKDNKESIAQAIKGYVHDMARAKSLLG